MIEKEPTVSIEFNHLIILARDKQQSATFLTQLLGLPAPEPIGFFLRIIFKNKVTFLYAEVDEEFDRQHYAFLVAEADFDNILYRIKEWGREYWADPKMEEPFKHYTYDGYRGLYVVDPSGHGMEILTNPE